MDSERGNEAQIIAASRILIRENGDGSANGSRSALGEHPQCDMLRVIHPTTENLVGHDLESRAHSET